MSRKALIAMSGGVDSSVAALLMQKKGYECIGATMRLFDNEDIGIFSRKSCCSLKNVEDARSVAYNLGMLYYVLNFKDDFKTSVIDCFISAYENGATPNPCIDCNRYMKSEKLYQRARILGCDDIVTGHYARIEKEKGRYLLKKAVDETKDQSYALYFMTQNQLAHTKFPLGNLYKSEVRKIAYDYDFINAGKQESQDICFVPDGNYAKIIEIHSGRSYPTGNIIDIEGNILGKHKGIIHYTIGQRKGLGLSLKEPMYVREKNVFDNTVTITKNEGLFSRELNAMNFNWIAIEKPRSNMRLKAKIRYIQTEQWATVTPSGLSTIHVTFDEPQRAITKGQAIVLYDDDIVIGGGTIC